MLSAAKRNELLEIVARMEGKRVLVIGDLILDHYIWGAADRVSPEAPVLVVHVRTEDFRAGGAGNVVQNLIELGAKVSVCGVIGADSFGADLIQKLSSRGVDTQGVIKDPSRETIRKTRVIAQSQQIVRVDRESTDQIGAATEKQILDFVRAHSAHVDAIIISDYAKGVITSKLFELFAALKPVIVVDPKQANFSIYKNATIIKPNRSEAQLASGMKIKTIEDAYRAGKKLLEIWPCQTVLITLGDQGVAMISRDGQTIHVPTKTREVYDVSGAGDTVSAVFTLALATGANLTQAAELANHAASVVVGEVGTVPITKGQLITELNEDHH
ncbi:D-glycero-beta-D-manno-heptose-7-phosphate kinase [bacterium]|nr:D-glycero-beta-D-manno-heptose-7-phosphate kinase [bacterium]